MKIAISAQGTDLSSVVDERFGRAPYFIVYDTETDNFEVLANEQNLTARQGAGTQTAQNVASGKVDIVISGNIGPKAFQVLSASGIKAVLWANGTVAEAIKLFRNNQIQPSESANVDGHWF